MKRTASTSFSLAALILAGVAASPAGAAESYTSDVVHSNFLFKVKHSDISYVFGRFNDFEANIVWDEEEPENGSVEFTIQTASVDTHNERRDQHLRSPDFFNAQQYPEIVFQSTEISDNGDDTYEVTGDVTLLGETRPVTFTWTETGAGPGAQGSFRRGGIANFTVTRSDFGMDFMLDRLSDEVELIVTVQAVREE